MLKRFLTASLVVSANSYSLRPATRPTALAPSKVTSRRETFSLLVGGISSLLVTTSSPASASSKDSCLEECVAECSKLVSKDPDGYCKYSCSNYCKEQGSSSSSSAGSESDAGGTQAASSSSSTPSPSQATAAPSRSSKSLSSTAGNFFKINELMQQGGQVSGL